MDDVQAEKVTIDSTYKQYAVDFYFSNVIQGKQPSSLLVYVCAEILCVTGRWFTDVSQSHLSSCMKINVSF
jgi:hypothetical protein